MGSQRNAVEENKIGDAVIASALKVHTALGPGLLESAYEACLAHELEKNGLIVRKQVAVPVIYEGLRLEAGYRIDLLIGEKVVVELKTVEKFAPVHMAQILSYLRLGGFKLGYLLNFAELHMRDGIKRVANGL